MDLEEVVKLLELMESHGLDEVEVEQGDVRIRLKKSSTQTYATPMIATPMHVAMPANGNMAVNGNAMPAAAEAKSEEDGLIHITSPMVGTLFRASSPDTDVFVREGDTVTDDTVVCIIEAMKVMNEVRAEVEGEIISILVENGESVEYGQPIMSVRPNHPPG